MTIQKMIATALTAAASLGLASVAMATPVILGSSTGSVSPNVFYTSGGTVTASDPAASYKDRTTNVITPAVFTLNGGTPGAFNGATETLSFTGGSFSYGTLLSGTFGSATLQQTATDAVLGDTFNFVSTNTVFTGGSDQHGFTNGTFSLEALNAFTLSGGTNIVNSTNTGFNSFNATDGVTINAIPSGTPEPGTVASFGFGGFGLLGLMIRARKTSKNVA